jgi:hypothetical protein
MRATHIREQLANKQVDGATLARVKLEGGYSWVALARHFGISYDAARSRVRSYLASLQQGVQDAGTEQADLGLDEAKQHDDESDHIDTTLTEEQVSRITSLDDLITFFKIDTTRWQVRDFRVNKWEQASKTPKGGVRVTPLYQVRANLIPNVERKIEIVRDICAAMIEDAKTHIAPVYGAVTYPLHPFATLEHADPDPMLFELAVFDTHLGMLAWGKEVGQPYDTNIAVEAYGSTVSALLRNALLYPVERILYIVGNDFLHVDGSAPSAKGMGRGGATSAGTMQDVDSRLARMFTAGRRALVTGIDEARTIAPVDVLVVPGNHDREQMYRMGEVLSAWYRECEDVNVIYSPMVRKFYNYGANTLMFTHGEEYRRSRDNLAMIMATECPAEWWVASEHGAREVHTGHSHINMQGGYYPTAEVSESRAIRTRSLPGLTPEDSWHFTEGYKHRRAGTALLYRKSGGFAGLHEFNTQ